MPSGEDQATGTGLSIPQRLMTGALSGAVLPNLFAPPQKTIKKIPIDSAMTYALSFSLNFAQTYFLYVVAATAGG